jgi:uncharacterized membrane protein YgdD (TMEM256/DUF423 family)
MDRGARNLAASGAFLALVAVALGAFAAHGLKSRLEPDLLAVFETGARYQMYHALALVAAGWAMTVGHARLARWAGRCFLAGTVIFSGSLYALALSGQRWLGAITPVGGLLFLAGWGLLAVAFLRRQD